MVRHTSISSGVTTNGDAVQIKHISVRPESCAEHFARLTTKSGSLYG
ncbi:MAG TPA: hypothetical protein VKF42_10385 [Chitinivibrionales bacterium]|nr:hypothetical protein [Chitinivibrionales bacterium]